MTTDTRYTSLDGIGREILTVGQLRAILAYVPAETQIVLDHEEWFANIGEVVVPGDPDDGAEYSAVTFVRGSTFDARQL